MAAKKIQASYGLLCKEPQSNNNLSQDILSFPGEVQTDSFISTPGKFLPRSNFRPLFPLFTFNATYIAPEIIHYVRKPLLPIFDT